MRLALFYFLVTEAKRYASISLRNIVFVGYHDALDKTIFMLTSDKTMVRKSDSYISQQHLWIYTWNQNLRSFCQLSSLSSPKVYLFTLLKNKSFPRKYIFHFWQGLGRCADTMISSSKTPLWIFYVHTNMNTCILLWIRCWKVINLTCFPKYNETSDF